MSASQARLEEILNDCLKESGATYEYQTKKASSLIWLELIQPLLYSVSKLQDNYSSLLEETGVSTHQFSIEQAQKVLDGWMGSL